MVEEHAATLGSASRVCERCGEEKPIDDFQLARPGKTWRKKSCRDCTRAYMRSWASSNKGRVQGHRKRTYEKRRDAYRILQKTTPHDLDGLRRALIEHPRRIEDEDAAAAYYRGYLAGAGRARRESEEVEGMKDLVFRIAQEFNVTWGTRRVRLSYEDTVSVAYEALLECLRKRRRDRPLVAVAIRRRITDALRDRFGRHFQAPDETTNLHGDDDREDLIGAAASAMDDDVDQADLMETILEAMPDERAREIVMRRAQGESLSEIGCALGLSESRTCQIFGELKPLVAAACGFAI